MVFECTTLKRSRRGCQNQPSERLSFAHFCEVFCNQVRILVVCNKDNRADFYCTSRGYKCTNVEANRALATVSCLDPSAQITAIISNTIPGTFSLSFSRGIIGL